MVEAARLKRELLLRWILAWTGLSAAWFLSASFTVLEDARDRASLRLRGADPSAAWVRTGFDAGPNQPAWTEWLDQETSRVIIPFHGFASLAAEIEKAAPLKVDRGKLRGGFLFASIRGAGKLLRQFWAANPDSRQVRLNGCQLSGRASF